MRITDSAVDLHPLLLSEVPVAVNTMDHLGRFEDPGQFPLVTFLHRLDRGGKKALWWYRQLIWSLACLTEVAVMGSDAMEEEARHTRVSRVKSWLVVASLKSVYV